MSAKTSNIQFHLGAAFTILSIAAIIFLLVIIWETYSNDLVTNSRYFNDYDTGFQDISDRNLISICCTWGDELIDGELTFIIRDDSAGNNLDSVTSQNRGSSLQKKEAVYNAVEDWDLRIEGLNFREVQNRYDADIEIRFREGKIEAAGLTNNLFDRFGLITKSFVTIYEREFPFEFGDDQIEQIAKHEIGHVLGLGHANFEDSLMSTHVHYGSGTISSCESQAVYEANHWKLNHKENGSNYYIYQPNINFLECKSIM